MSTAIRIGGALLFGALIILVAFFVQSDSYAKQPKNLGTVVSNTAPERVALAVRDENNNGTPDWEEDLEQIFVVEAALASSTIFASSSEPYTPPTTFTGKFSEAFLQDYLEGKIKGQDYTDPSAFVGNAIQAIEQNTKNKTHSPLEVATIPTTFDSVREYGNTIASLMELHSAPGDPEAVILERALEAKDESILTELKPIHEAYKGLIADTVALEVPDALIQEHTNLLNAYEMILTDIEAMQVAFSDPLFALARVRDYQSHAQRLVDSLEALTAKFVAEGVTYAEEEPGSLFYLFTP